MKEIRKEFDHLYSLVDDNQIYIVEQIEKVVTDRILELESTNKDLNREIGRYTNRLFDIASENYKLGEKSKALINDMLNK